MNQQLQKDLADLKIRKDVSAITKLITLGFKLWFVWAIVWLVGVITVLGVVWHFIHKWW